MVPGFVRSLAPRLPYLAPLFALLVLISPLAGREAALAAPPAIVAPAPPAFLDVAAAEGQFLDLLNADRVANGLPALVADQRLMDLARWRSEDMVARNYFSHDIGGLTIFQVLRDRQIRFRVAGENLADNDFDEARTVPIAEAMLMASPGHRANILRPEFDLVGVGIAVAADGRIVYTQVFIQD